METFKELFSADSRVPPASYEVRGIPVKQRKKRGKPYRKLTRQQRRNNQRQATKVNLVQKSREVPETAMSIAFARQLRQDHRIQADPKDKPVLVALTRQVLSV